MGRSGGGGGGVAQFDGLSFISAFTEFALLDLQFSFAPQASVASTKLRRSARHEATAPASCLALRRSLVMAQSQLQSP